MTCGKQKKENILLFTHHDHALTEVQPQCDTLGGFSLHLPDRFKRNRKPTQPLRGDASLG